MSHEIRGGDAFGLHEILPDSRETLTTTGLRRSCINHDGAPRESTGDGVRTTPQRGPSLRGPRGRGERGGAAIRSR